MDKGKSVFDELIPSDDISLQQILNNLLDGKHNLDLKTEIFRPKDLASLKVFAEFLGKLNFSKSELIINNFIKTYLRYMISYERKSRTETIKAFTSLYEREKLEITRRLTTNMV